jgi:hypothetical protein
MGIDARGHALVGHEVGGRVFLGVLALVQDHLDLDAALVGIEQCFGDRRRSEGISLHQDGALSAM